MNLLNITESDFLLMVEERVLETDESYIQATIHICEENNTDPESIGWLIGDVLKEKIVTEAKELHLIRGLTKKDYKNASLEKLFK